MKFRTQEQVILFAAIALLSINVIHAFAQDKKKKPASQATTPTPAPPAQLAAYDSTRYSYFLFPQFYSYWPINNKDTVLKYECYDADGDYINMDTVYNINDVKQIYFTKTHLDYTQTIIDAEGKPRSKPVTLRLYKYDRTKTDNIWTALDLTNRYASTLQEYKETIVRADTTVVIDPITGTRQVTVRKYYKVLELEKNEDGSTAVPAPSVPDPIETTKDDKQKTDAAVYVYSVPEFYYYVPKKHYDTTLEFLCYDYRDSLMANVTDYDSVHYYSLFKSYTDSAHTYKDSNGEKKLLPVSSIIKRYDHLAGSKWMSVEYPKNKYTELKAHKDITTRTDSITVIDPLTDRSILKVFNYYKVTK